MRLDVFSQTALAAGLLAAAMAHGAQMREYRQVAISGGESIAAIESSDPGVPGRRAWTHRRARCRQRPDQRRI